jgi:hypothetical protein
MCQIRNNCVCAAFNASFLACSDGPENFSFLLILIGTSSFPISANPLNTAVNGSRASEVVVSAFFVALVFFSSV